MEDSILISTKKILNISAEYTAFDIDIITHINSVFNILNQMGIGLENYFIENTEETWDQFLGDGAGLNMVRSYVFLKVRMLFDPPTASFGIEAMNNQIKEFEWRLSTLREWNLDPVDPRAA